MKIKNTSVINQNSITLNQFRSKHKYQILENYWKKRKSVKKIFQNFDNRELWILFFLLASVMWVQVPRWEADWSKFALDVPDS